MGNSTPIISLLFPNATFSLALAKLASSPRQAEANGRPPEYSMYGAVFERCTWKRLRTTKVITISGPTPVGHSKNRFRVIILAIITSGNELLTHPVRLRDGATRSASQWLTSLRKGLMRVLCLLAADWKSPPQASRIVHSLHSFKYMFFQSEIDFLAKGHNLRSSTHS